MPPAAPTTQDEPDSPGPDEPPSILIELVRHTDITGLQIEDWLSEQFQRAVELCHINDAQLNLVIVADDEMAQLHEQYTGVSGTTDVLTFDLTDSAESSSPSWSDAHPAPLEGDIILCLDEAKRQAEQRNHPVRHELLLYAIHGLLHLLGEDDHEQDAYQRMHAREDELLQSLGIGRVFNSNSNPNA